MLSWVWSTSKELRNQHAYSDFRLFNVASTQRIGKPKNAEHSGEPAGPSEQPEEGVLCTIANTEFRRFYIEFGRFWAFIPVYNVCLMLIVQ